MAGQYFLSGVIELKDPDGSVFALEEEDDTFIYSGKFTINGKEVAEPDDSEEHYYHLYYDYYSEANWIEFSYYFPVTENTPEKAEYSFTEDGGQTWTKGSDQGASFTVKSSVNDEETFKRFTELKVDGKTISEDSYTTRQGSLIAELKASYLETLSEGKHTLTAVFEDCSAETDFTVVAAKEPEEETTPADDKSDKGDKITPADKGDKSGDKTPPANNKGKKTVKTEDKNNPTAWLILMAASLIVMAGIGVRRHAEKRKR